MPMNPAFVQLVLGLRNLSMQKRQITLDENKFDEQKTQFKKMAEQWAHEHEDKDFAAAITDLSKFVPEQQDAYLRLLRSKTGQQNPDAIAALQQFGMASPVAQGAQSMTPQQRTGVNQEAATLAMTGGAMGTGAAGTSQMQGALSGLGPMTPGMQQAGMTSDVFANLVRNRAGMLGQGYTGEQMGLQQFQAATGRGGVELGFAELREKHNQFLASYHLNTALKNAEIQGGKISSSDAVSLMRGMGDLLNDIKKPQSSAKDNLARQQLYNQINAVLRQNGYLGTGTFEVPGGQQGNLGGEINPNSMLKNFRQGQFGAPMPGTFNPAMQPDSAYARLLQGMTGRP